MLSKAFRSDLKGKNNEIIPIVVIEKKTNSTSVNPGDSSTWDDNFRFYRLSTNHLTIEDEYYTPILVDFPNFALYKNIIFSLYFFVSK